MTIPGGDWPPASPEEIDAVARLSAGDVDLARFLLSERGREIRAQAERLAAAALGGADADDDSREADAGNTPWELLLQGAEEAGDDAEAAAREALEDEKEAGVKRSARDIADAAKRAGRRRRTDLLDLGLSLAAAWFRDLAATASGAADVAYNSDRLTQLQSQATGLDPGKARRAAELVQDTRRRLDLNVSEELALEALSFRLAAVLG